jgi:xylan 1,4-beta-xylosidase
VLKLTGHIILKGEMKNEALQFYYGYDEANMKKIGEEQNAGILSDDYVRKGGLHDRPAFTGAFTGICCQDVSGEKKFADFGWFEYKGKD